MLTMIEFWQIKGLGVL